MTERVRILKEGTIAHAVLNRPDKYNAFDIAMFEALVEAAAELDGDTSVRAVILRGEGKGFSSGLDVMSAMSSPANIPKLMDFAEGDIANLAQNCCWCWRSLKVPVLAAVHGVAMGAGMQLILGADMRYAHPDTQFSIREAHWGLIPDMSGSQTLRDLTRLDIAKELTFTARKFSAEEALTYGLITAISDDPLAHAQQVAEEIASRSPDAVARAKVLFQESWQGSHADGLALEAKLQGQLLGTPNQMEAIQANLQKRAPHYKPRG